jgi:plastocyanin
VKVQSGEALTVINQTNDFHSFTVVNRSDQPKDVNGALVCFTTGPCSNPPAPTATIGKVGDGTYAVPNGTFTIPVVAPTGSVLYFMCLFHPEMQGKIIVQGDD